MGAKNREEDTAGVKVIKPLRTRGRKDVKIVVSDEDRKEYEKGGE